MRERVFSRLVAVLLGILLLFLVPSLGAAPAHASGDTLTLQITNGPTFSYNGPCINFSATLTLGTALGGNYGDVMNIFFSTGQSLGMMSKSVSADRLTYSFATCSSVDGNSQPIQVGNNLTAYGEYDNTDTHTTTKSNIVTFSVVKAASTTWCGYGNDYYFNSPGTQVTVGPTVNGVPASPGEQYSITFTGPVTSTTTMTVDAYNRFQVTFPSTPGRYTLTCAFLGNGQYLPSSEEPWGKLIVSLMRKLGGIRISTNPTTFTPGRSTQFSIVFLAAPGGPTPSGYFVIQIGQSSTHQLPIGPDGRALVTVDPLNYAPSPASIVIFFIGDPYYDNQEQTFSLTNPPFTTPPIPTPSTSGHSGGNVVATATSGATPTVTESATPVATATTAPLADESQPTGRAQTPGANWEWVLWVIGAAVMLQVLGAGVVLYLLRSKRVLPTSEQNVV